MAQVFNITFDARDPRRLAAFWSAAVDGTMTDVRDDFARVIDTPHGTPNLLFIQVDDPTPGKNRIHIDLAVADVVAESTRLIALGARAADLAADGTPGWREANGISWVTLVDPEGNEFCIGGMPDEPAR